MFQHHPDGWIYVRGTSQTYCDTPANFATDFGQAYSGLPAGYIERIYDPAKNVHFLGTGSSQSAQPIPWALGDSYIAALSQLIANQTTRLTPPVVPLTLQQAQAAQIAAIQAHVAAIQNSGIPYVNAAGIQKVLPSDQLTGEEFLYAEQAAQANPAFTFTITYMDMTQETLTAAEIIQIPIQCSAYMQQYFDREAALIAQVVAATTVAQVQAVPIS